MIKINLNNKIKSCNKNNFILKNIKNNILNMELIYDSNFENSKILRDYIGVICDNYSICNIEKSRLILICDELSNNAIEHWNDFKGVNKVRINIKKDKNILYINIEIEDSANWYNAKNASQMETIRNEKLNDNFILNKSIRWRWLFNIVEKIVDKLYFKNSINWWLIVWVNKEIIIC